LGFGPSIADSYRARGGSLTGRPSSHPSLRGSRSCVEAYGELFRVLARHSDRDVAWWGLKRQRPPIWGLGGQFGNAARTCRSAVRACVTAVDRGVGGTVRSPSLTKRGRCQNVPWRHGGISKAALVAEGGPHGRRLRLGAQVRLPHLGNATTGGMFRKDIGRPRWRAAQCNAVRICR
jgi:hypothetical protein